MSVTKSIQPTSLFDRATGIALKIIQDGSDYLLGIAAKIQNSTGTVINPATEDTLQSVETSVTDGSQKVQVVDAAGEVLSRESSGIPELYTYSESETYELTKIRQELTHIRLILSAALEIGFEEGEDT